ncbi:glycosyltransferase family 39 protein, partial [Candidatus Daviesbacteria bacterium]|nr:glycosyltransferase family 39 protein [Candidatus Daviesbacteria bacterium]
MKYKLVLAFILVLGFILRIADINNNPPALYGDELTIALDANSILRSGKDQLGNPFPLTFSMGAGRPAGYVYASVPFVALFGPNALGVRMLSILSGMGVIVLFLLLGKRFFSPKVGLIAAFIIAVSPWAISLSRGGFEANFALFLALLAVYFFARAKEKGIFYIFSFFAFGLSLHTYPTYKLSLMLFLPLLFWYQGVKIKKYFLVGVVVFLLFGILAFTQTFIGGSEKRFSEINVFSQRLTKEQITQRINFERTITNLPSNISRYFHNKPVEYGKVLIENYLQNFSLDFLVLHGDRNPRHNMATMGEFYLAAIILILFGALALLQKNKKIFLFFVFWLMIAPLPASLVDLPHALRSSFMLPPLIFLSALGLSVILDRKNKLMLILLATLFGIQFLFFVQKLFFLAPNEYSRFWSDSAKKASQTALENKQKYDFVIVSDSIDNIEFAYPVYARVDPNMVIARNQARSELGG